MCRKGADFSIFRRSSQKKKEWSEFRNFSPFPKNTDRIITHNFQVANFPKKLVFHLIEELSAALQEEWHNVELAEASIALVSKARCFAKQNRNHS